MPIGKKNIIIAEAKYILAGFISLTAAPIESSKKINRTDENSLKRYQHDAIPLH
ncbi:TPA: hypothetical protein ACNVU4_002603 [Morganella morganii]